MNSELDPQTGQTEAEAATPSADFIQAISRFLDTDPDDLLLELGYYSRADQDRSAEAEGAA